AAGARMASATGGAGRARTARTARGPAGTGAARVAGHTRLPSATAGSRGAVARRSRRPAFTTLAAGGTAAFAAAATSLRGSSIASAADGRGQGEQGECEQE